MTSVSNCLCVPRSSVVCVGADRNDRGRFRSQTNDSNGGAADPSSVVPQSPRPGPGSRCGRSHVSSGESQPRPGVPLSSLCYRSDTAGEDESPCAGDSSLWSCHFPGMWTFGVAARMDLFHAGDLWPERLLCVWFIFSLVLLVIHGCQMVETPSRMLVLHAVTLLTMYLGVCSGQMVDITKPRLVLVNILLVPAMCMMGCLVARLMLRAHSGYMLFSFVFLVPFTGLVFGLKTERHQGEEPLLYNTFDTIQSVVYSAELLTGILGILTGIRLSLWDLGRAGRLAFWTSVPAAVTLYVLGGDILHTHLLRVCVGAGGVLGLPSGLAAAAGVAVGLAIVPLGEPCLYLIVALNRGTVDDVIVLLNLFRAAVGRGGGRGNNSCVFVNAGVEFAVLSAVMMGSTVLGGAGFLTAGLGSLGRHGMVIAGIITMLKAVYLLCDLNM